MSRATRAITIVALLAAVVGLQALQERRAATTLPVGTTGNLLYVRSPEAMKRAALSYDALVADVYWIRALQHYGGTKLSTDVNKRYDLLYPLLDLTTSLDPYFDVAYRFGAIFLAEQHPGGAGRPCRREGPPAPGSRSPRGRGRTRGPAPPEPRAWRTGSARDRSGS